MAITYGYSAISRALVEESSAALADSKKWLYTISPTAISFIPSPIGKLPAIFRHCNAVGPRRKVLQGRRDLYRNSTQLLYICARSKIRGFMGERAPRAQIWKDGDKRKRIEELWICSIQESSEAST